MLTLVVLAGLLIEVDLRRFRKIPFACSYLPGKARWPLLFWGGVALLTSGLQGMVAMERWVFGGTARTVAVLVMLATAVLWVAWRTEGGGGRELELAFEETNEDELTALRLK